MPNFGVVIKNGVAVAVAVAGAGAGAGFGAGVDPFTGVVITIGVDDIMLLCFNFFIGTVLY